MPDIDELWILRSDGLPFAEIDDSRSPDSMIFGGLISAIQSLLEMFYEKGTVQIIIGDSRIHIIPCCDGKVLLVCKSRLKVNEKKLHKMIDKFITFVESEKSLLDRWKGSDNVLESFRKKLIDIYFEEVKI
jgi:hypothetical protein